MSSPAYQPSRVVSGRAPLRPVPATQPGRRPRPEFLTVKEVASVLRIARMSVYRLCEDGTLKSFRVGRTIRIPAAAFDQFLAEAQK
jgi:excisionase family DNA binding protein